jgi:hypothetical protein
MSDDSLLRKKVQEAVRAGSLPNRRPDRTWGGPGSGACCTICGARVGRDEVEFEIEFGGEDTAQPSSYYVHVQCFAAWEAERRKIEAGTESQGTPAPAAGDQSATPP